jgi:hypothetical protein
MAFSDDGELMTLTEFMTAFGTRRVIEIDTTRDAAGNSPWIVIRSGQFAAVLVPQDLDGEYLDIDVHPFVNGLGATASVFAMSGGRDVPGLAKTGTTSYRRPSAQLVAVIIGEQGTDPFTCSGTRDCRAPEGAGNHAHYCPRHPLNARAAR